MNMVQCSHCQVWQKHNGICNCCGAPLPEPAEPDNKTTSSWKTFVWASDGQHIDTTAIDRVNKIAKRKVFYNAAV